MTLLELKKLAQSATPGRWEYVDGEVIKYEDRESGEFSLQIADEGLDGEWKYNGRFIAAMNPSTALRMIELLERAKPFVEHVMSGPSHIWLKDLEEL